jgi:hypothetical protein
MFLRRTRALSRLGAKRPTRKRVGHQFAVPDYRLAANEQVLYPDRRPGRIHVRRGVTDGDRIEHDDVCVGPWRQVAL